MFYLLRSFKTANGSSARIDRNAFSSNNNNKKKLSSNPDIANKNKIRNSNTAAKNAFSSGGFNDNSTYKTSLMKSAGSNGNINSNYYLNGDMALQMEELKISK